MSIKHVNIFLEIYIILIMTCNQYIFKINSKKSTTTDTSVSVKNTVTSKKNNSKIVALKFTGNKSCSSCR